MKYKLEKTIVALFLLAFMLVGFFGSKAYLQIGPQIRSVTAKIQKGPEKKSINTAADGKKKDIGTETDTSAASAGTTASTVSSETTASTASSETAGAAVKEETAEVEAKKDEETEEAANFSDSLFFKQQMVQGNGAISKQLGMSELYNQDNTFVLNNGYVVGVYAYADTDYEFEKVTGFRDFLAEQGIPLLYVNEPVKYTDDKAISEELGIMTYVNDNADRMLARLSEAGIPTLDLRQAFSGEDSFFWFYRTDHHWTTSAGKVAAEAISEKLNSDLGFDIDLSLYSDEKMIYTLYEDAWLGEQGKKLGESFVGMEDYTLIVPSYDTLFTIRRDGEEYTGSFEEVLINNGIMLPENNEDIYGAPSWHYIYRGNEGRITNEQNTDGKKLLVLGDSYGSVTNVFLALGNRSVEGIIMRDFIRDFDIDIRDYILQNDYDAVIISYAEFMLGAHVDEESANYTMFDF